MEQQEHLYILLALAISIGLGALYLASAAIKKTQHDLTEFANVMRGDFGGLKSQLAGKVKALESKMSDLQMNVGEAMKVEAAARTLFDEVTHDLADLRAAVTELETAIPPKNRGTPHMA